MRSFREFVIDIVKKPPVLFPLVGLFHVLLLARTIWDDRHVPVTDIAWVEVLWMTAYTMFWLAACDMRKWGALAYMLLTATDACVYLAVRNHLLPIDAISNMFLIDALFSVFLLYYYKRFN